MTAAVEIKTIPGKPKQGMGYLSINLAIVERDRAFALAAEMGFQAEAVKLVYPSGHSESHVLLWSGPIDETPADLEEKFFQLADLVEGQAIRYALGQSRALAQA